MYVYHPHRLDPINVDAFRDNILYVDHPPRLDPIDVDAFRDNILL